MIRVNQIKLKPNHTTEELKETLLHILKIKSHDLIDFYIRKQSIDARKKPDIFYVYTIDVNVLNEASLFKRIKKNTNISIVSNAPYRFPKSGTKKLNYRPVVVGSGPAGLFCAYALAQQGYRPILIERGAPVEKRTEDVNRFWETGMLDTESNVQFGEGGAGTFSDGKLNTLVKDPLGRNRMVLDIFIKHGGPKEIAYINKPHVGTDLLKTIVRNMREEIIALGGTVKFHTKLTNFSEVDGTLEKLILNHEEELLADVAVIALGHSARDTFHMLYENHIEMEAKSFAVGVRIEHLQKTVNDSQYGKTTYKLSPAEYKLTAKLPSKRGVYTFCMCPGGYVVNASSERDGLAVNGMSYHARDGANSNSAVIVTVTPDDFKSAHPLAGISFQQQLERRAYAIGNGRIPIQLFGDFCQNQISKKTGEISPCLKGEYTFANLREIFPESINKALEEGIQIFDKKLRGFSNENAILSGVESRTSSPLRILRDENLHSSIKGLFPCGEGAGYAGGITSAAMDGLKVAEKIIETYDKFDM